MSYQKTLAEIPIVTPDARAGRRLHWKRRAVQLATIAVAILIPASGLFRIDPVAGAFVVLDRQIWFSDFYLIIGLWLAVSSLLVMTYSFVGTAFCGWSCPQNTLSEWANRMTHRLLGKRAEVSLDGAPMRVSRGKDKWLNWSILGASFLAAAMAAALVPMFYFYPPEVIWKFATLQDDPRLAGSLHWIYSIFVLIILLDIAFIRHFWCRFMCIYRVWQHSFKTRETLHIAHDKTHAQECAQCNFCETSCFIGIDPRRTETFDACINCGECITACSGIRESRGTGNSLLRFEVGERSDGCSTETDRRRSNVGSIMLRVPWAALLTAFGLGLFVWGVRSYETYHFTVHQTQSMQETVAYDYGISIANKLYRPAAMEIDVEGLPESAYRLEAEGVTFGTAGRKEVGLHISAQLSPGVHPFVVRVKSKGGQAGASFRVHHFVAETGT